VSIDGTDTSSEAAELISADGYRYDLFLSYRRTPNVSAWVHNHFHPRLRDCLSDELADEPRIFLDVAQDPGTPWPANLRYALQRSRLMVAVLSPPYFRSRWCLAEWQTILRREQMLGLDGPQSAVRLVYPVQYSDGEEFARNARHLQMDDRFKKLRYPQPAFAESNRYLDFHDALVSLAECLADRLRNAPSWQPDWPIEEPEPSAPAPASVPRF